VLGAALSTGNQLGTNALPITAEIESVSLASPIALSEGTLDGAMLTLTLTSVTYESRITAGSFRLSSVPGLTVSSVARTSDTVATLTLGFDGTDFDRNTSLSVTVLAAALSTGNQLSTNALPITAEIESVSLPSPIPFSQGTLAGG